MQLIIINEFLTVAFGFTSVTHSFQNNVFIGPECQKG